MKHIFKQCSDFSEGMATVLTNDGYWTYINSDLDFVNEGIRFYGVRAFSEGIAAVHDRESFTYIDKNLNYIDKDKKFARCGEFHCDLAAVTSYDDYVTKFFIDKNLNKVECNIKLNYVCSFRDGFWVLTDKDGLYYYVDKNLSPLVGDKYFDCAYDFNDGIAPVAINSMGYNYIDKNADFIFPNNFFLSAFSYSNGCFLVKKKNDQEHESFIDINLKTIKTFEFATPFRDDMAIVSIPNKNRYTFIGKDFNYIDYSKDFSDAESFYDGFARVHEDNDKRMIFIDKKLNKMELDTSITFINRFHEGKAVVFFDDGTSGYINENMEIL